MTIDHGDCLRCGTPFKASFPEGQVTHLCDRCFGVVMNYVTTAATPRQVHARLKAIHRLYVAPEAPSSPATDPSGEDVLGLDVPCDPDFDPTDAEIEQHYGFNRGPSVMEQHRAAWDLRTGWM